VPSSVLLLGEEDHAAGRFLKLPLAYFSGFGSQAIIEAWRMDYNHHRPHSSLGHLTPNEFVAQRQGQPTIEEVVCSG